MTFVDLLAQTTWCDRGCVHAFGSGNLNIFEQNFTSLIIQIVRNSLSFLYIKNSTSHALSLYIILSILCSTSVFKRSIVEHRPSNIQLGVSSFLFTDFLGFPTHHSDASPRSPQTCPVQWHGPAELWKTSESERPWKAYGLTLWVPPPL